MKYMNTWENRRFVERRILLSVIVTHSPLEPLHAWAFLHDSSKWYHRGDALYPCRLVCSPLSFSSLSRLIEVHLKFKLMQETIFSAVNILDRYASSWNWQLIIPLDILHVNRFVALRSSLLVSLRSLLLPSLKRSCIPIFFELNWPVIDLHPRSSRLRLHHWQRLQGGRCNQDGGSYAPSPQLRPHGPLCSPLPSPFLKGICRFMLPL